VGKIDLSDKQKKKHKNRQRNLCRCQVHEIKGKYATITDWGGKQTVISLGLGPPSEKKPKQRFKSK